MKNCKKIHPLLSLYRENQLSASQKAAVEKHVVECPAAREELKQEDRLYKALKKLPEPKMPRDLHEKIMARLYGKPTPQPHPFWPRASWGLAAAAGLAFIFCIQNFNWVGNKNSEIVLKPAPSETGSAKVPSQTKMALKPQTHHPVNRPATAVSSQPEMAKSDVKLQSAAAPLTQAQLAINTPPPMVLAMAAPHDKKMNVMTDNRQFVFQANSHIAQEDASVPAVNDNRQPETKLALNYSAIAAAPQATITPEFSLSANSQTGTKSALNYGILPVQPSIQQTPQFIRFNIVGFNYRQYQVTWQTNLVSQGQLFVLDSSGNTLQAVAETTPSAYDHEMVVNASTINTGFFIKILSTYSNGSQAVTMSNILKPQ